MSLGKIYTEVVSHIALSFGNLRKSRERAMIASLFPQHRSKLLPAKKLQKRPVFLPRSDWRTMCPEHARVILAEDSETWRQFIWERLEDAGHTVYLAKTLPELGELIYGQMNRLGIQVIVADQRLENFEEAQKRLLGDQGEPTDTTPLLTWVKDTHPDISVIGLSGWGNVKGADIQMDKNDSDTFENIGEIVTHLPG